MAKVTMSKAATQRVIDLETEIKTAQAEIDRAKKAGIDVSKAEAELNKDRALRDVLLKEYAHPDVTVP